MPRYFFHVMKDGHPATDAGGRNYHDMDEVRAEALKAAQEIIRKRAEDGTADGDDLIEIKDEHGTVVETVTFAALMKKPL